MDIFSCHHGYDYAIWFCFLNLESFLQSQVKGNVKFVKFTIIIYNLCNHTMTIKTSTLIQCSTGVCNTTSKVSSCFMDISAIITVENFQFCNSIVLLQHSSTAVLQHCSTKAPQHRNTAAWQHCSTAALQHYGSVVPKTSALQYHCTAASQHHSIAMLLHCSTGAL